MSHFTRWFAASLTVTLLAGIGVVYEEREVRAETQKASSAAETKRQKDLAELKDKYEAQIKQAEEKKRAEWRETARVTIRPMIVEDLARHGLDVISEADNCLVDRLSDATADQLGPEMPKLIATYVTAVRGEDRQRKTAAEQNASVAALQSTIKNTIRDVILGFKVTSGSCFNMAKTVPEQRRTNRISSRILGAPERALFEMH